MKFVIVRPTNLKPKCSIPSVSPLDSTIKKGYSKIIFIYSCDKFYNQPKSDIRTTSLGYGNKHDFFKK